MADNYLERQYDDYLARKAAAERARRLRWQKQLRAYKQRLASNPDPQKQAPTRGCDLPET